MSEKSKKSRPSLRGLQVLRAIAAFLVVVTHSGFYTSERLSKGFHFWSRGAVGVDIFFVLSGFVMYYSSAPLLANRDGWKIFIERRLVRIVPLYWLATSVKLFMMLAVAGAILHAKLSISKTIFAYLFIPARNVDNIIMPLLGVGWTLNFEMFFYLLFAVALAFRKNVLQSVGCILVCLAVGSYFVGPDGPAVIFYLNPIVLDFLWGMLIAYIYEARTPTINWKICTLAVAVGFIVILTPLPGGSELAVGIAAATIVSFTVLLEPHLEWIPRWTLFLGDASYAIYLFHPLVVPIIPTLLAKAHIVIVPLSIVLSVLLGLGAGSLIHKFIELPMTSFFRSHIRFQGQRIIHLPDSVSKP